MIAFSTELARAPRRLPQPGFSGEVVFVALQFISLALGMALHELSTNAVKYGALRSDDGTIRIQWRIEDGHARMLHFDWIELDGPPVTPPTNSGFGSAMIERMLRSQIGGTVEVSYEQDGLKFHLNVPLSNVELVP